MVGNPLLNRTSWRRLSRSHPIQLDHQYPLFQLTDSRQSQSGHFNLPSVGIITKWVPPFPFVYPLTFYIFIFPLGSFFPHLNSAHIANPDRKSSCLSFKMRRTILSLARLVTISEARGRSLGKNPPVKAENPNA